MKKLVPIILLFIVVFSSCQQKKIEQSLPELNFDLQTASVKTEGGKLIVSTGKVERIWKLTN